MAAVWILGALIACVSALALVYLLWQAGVSCAAKLKKPADHPEAEPLRYAVIVCARDEERVIGGILRSLQDQDYPKDRYEVFTAAHNCRDHTAEIAEECGAAVLVRNAPEERQKSDALRFVLEYLERERPGEFDCFAVFDADSVAAPDFLREINKAFAAGADAVSGYYESKNFGADLVSRLSGTLYYVVMHNTCEAHDALGLPVNIYGTGFAVRMKWAGEIRQLHTLVEDFELTIRLVLKKAKLVFAPKAVFYAEMPTDLKTAVTQRRRWTYGDYQCFWAYRKALRHSIRACGLSGVKQYADALMVPVSQITIFGILLGLLLTALLGKAGIYLLFLLGVFVLFGLTCSAIAADALKSRQKPLRENLAVILLFSAWIALSMLLAVECVFRSAPEWTATPRAEDGEADEREEQAG